MTLVHRILSLDLAGGRFGIGQVTGEADIHPDDWFLTCHFVDDQVMPGTLMYECCLHTLRVMLLRMGFVGEAADVVYEPVPGVSSQLKCRGQVIATTKKVQYEVTLKEIGFDGEGEGGTPFVLADALMFGDGKPIVQMSNMSVRMTGMTREGLLRVWGERRGGSPRIGTPGIGIPGLRGGCDAAVGAGGAPLFDRERITAFAIGRPSEAFGEAYRVFDEARVIARLPGPPYQFLDRITRIENCEPFVLEAGAVIDAEYDVPADPADPEGWYFDANRQDEMPFAVLLEAALQPCGWLAAYLGSALKGGDVDLSFRNLGGRATQRQPVTRESGTLTTTVKLTSTSLSGGMIIQHYDMSMWNQAGPVYDGTTYFGFFSKEALANQIGLREAKLHKPDAAAIARATAFDIPDATPYPDATWRMVEHVEHYDPQGGPHGLGVIRATTPIDPSRWFFKAHFYQDPVWPGSLGLESFLQLLKLVAVDRFGPDVDVFMSPLADPHAWTYRGQVLPTDKQVAVEAVITELAEPGDNGQAGLVRGNGFLTVDGRIIYQMQGFAIRMQRRA